MSVATQTGFFYITHPKWPEALAYRCNSCGVFKIFGDGPLRVWCCGQWKTPPEENFFIKLPRVASTAPSRGLTLPGNKISFDPDPAEGLSFR
jgi:hypothetical protein